MSVAVDIFEDVFEHKRVSSVAATLTVPAAGAAAQLEDVRRLQARIRAMQAVKLDTRRIPTHPALAGLLPGGSLRQGSAYSIEGSTTLLMALVAGPSAAGAWCGVVGVPEFGAEAAASYGIDLERLILVPTPGDRWLGVIAAVADVLSVVVTRPPERVGNANVARLAARLRQRGATLLVLGDWPQSEAVLRISHSTWSGIGNGHGYLTARQVTVTAMARTGGRARTARLWLPDGQERFRRVEGTGGQGGHEWGAGGHGLEPGTGTRGIETDADRLREAAG
jgi:hypothetical protein